MSNVRPIQAPMHQRQIVRPQLSVSRLPGTSTSTIIRPPTLPIRHTIIIRAPPPPQPMIIRAPAPRPSIIIHAPRPSIVPPPPPPPQSRVHSLIPLHQITPPTVQPATIQPPTQAAMIIRAPAQPTDEPITFKLKGANVSVHGVVQDYMFLPRRSHQRDLLKFIRKIQYKLCTKISFFIAIF